MGQHLHMALAFPGSVAVATQGRSQAAFEPGDHALDLPTLAIRAAMKPPEHLPAITAAGPATGAAAHSSGIQQL
jgi:hypothetical protein